MFPPSEYLQGPEQSLLHACGDVSALLLFHHHFHRSAPRMWRCFHDMQRPSDHRGVCSTHVEMFPWRSPTGRYWPRLLHACGDVSSGYLGSYCIDLSAPRMWRCFYKKDLNRLRLAVCSTHVEMFLPYSVRLSSWEGLLHACGDVSTIEENCVTAFRSAPRMWRCFSYSLI